MTLYSSIRNNTFANFLPEINYTINDINELINDSHTICNLRKIKYEKKIRLNDIIERNTLVAIYSLEIDKKDFNNIKKLNILMGFVTIWSLDFKFILGMSKYKNGIIYFPSNLLHNENSFLPLHRTKYHDIDIEFDLCNDKKENINININFLVMKIREELVDDNKMYCLKINDYFHYFELINKDFIINKIVVDYFYNPELTPLKKSCYIYKLYEESCRGIYVKSKNLTDAYLCYNSKVDDIIKCKIINIKTKQLNISYKELYKLKLPFDIIKNILEYLYNIDGLYYIQFDENNNYLELQTCDRVNLITNKEIENMFVGVNRNLLIFRGCLSCKTFCH